MSNHRHEIARCLVISTAHITKKVRDLLESGTTRIGIAYATYDYGYIIFWFDSEADKILPRCLKEVKQEAYLHGCTWVRLDADADTNPNLPTYDW